MNLDVPTHWAAKKPTYQVPCINHMHQLMNTVPKGACTRLVTLKYFLLHYFYDLLLEEKKM